MVPISITNLAERHLRPGFACASKQPERKRNINHESSRKAFETHRYGPPGSQIHIISITNLAERHLRLMSVGSRPPRTPPRISITNLAERHLRLFVGTLVPPDLCSDINHESSRKAFETGRVYRFCRYPCTHINHESSRKAFETPWSERLTFPLPQDINHESSRKAFETCSRVLSASTSIVSYQSRI